MTTALVIVDVQYDFCPGGSLGTERGHEVAAGIAKHMREQDYAAVVATQDWHIDPKGHFSENPDYVDTWPVHCVAESPGAELHADLDVNAIDELFRKGEYTAAYSGFEGFAASDSSVTLANWLRDHGITRVTVVGIATDHCVRATAADALTAGFDVTILSALCSPVDVARGHAALDELRQAGAEIVA